MGAWGPCSTPGWKNGRYCTAAPTGKCNRLLKKNGCVCLGEGEVMPRISEKQAGFCPVVHRWVRGKEKRQYLLSMV